MKKLLISIISALFVLVPIAGYSVTLDDAAESLIAGETGENAVMNYYVDEKAKVMILVLASGEVMVYNLASQKMIAVDNSTNKILIDNGKNVQLICPIHQQDAICINEHH